MRGRDSAQGGWKKWSLRNFGVGERWEGSEGLISLGSGRGHLRVARGLRGVGGLSHCVLRALGREDWGRRD